jgi:type II secretory pathway component PulK
MMIPSRRGFALIFVLWVVVSASGLAIALAGIGRAELDVIRQRMRTVRAQWTASGCLEQVRADAEGQIWSDGYTPASVDASWATLDQLVLAPKDCRIEIRSSGLTLDVNTANSHQLRRLFQMLGLRGVAIDSLADAILDWRDSDGEPRERGAETAWYAMQGRVPPRNRPFADVAELALVRGIDPWLLERGVLGVATQRVHWRRADLSVIATLPGMTDEVLEVLSSRGAAQLTDLSTLVDFPEMPPAARDSLARATHLLLPMITSRIEFWAISATPAGSEAGYVRATMRIGVRDGYLEVLERRFIP